MTGISFSAISAIPASALLAVIWNWKPVLAAQKYHLLTSEDSPASHVGSPLLSFAHSPLPGRHCMFTGVGEGGRTTCKKKGKKDMQKHAMLISPHINVLCKHILRKKNYDNTNTNIVIYLPAL